LNNSDHLPDNSEVIKARTLRKEQAQLHKQEQQAKVTDSHKNTQSTTPQESANKKSDLQTDHRKAKIAAAIAKARAQKTAHKD